MAYKQFSLSWNAYNKNLSSGLSSLQQNGEFVDMTLAADGHLVKVHQVVLALVSPYIKDMISSAQTQHPIIFLNKISYETLNSILEYIYTGEVIVTDDNVYKFLEAGKELHIKGLEDMTVPDGYPKLNKDVNQITFVNTDLENKISGENVTHSDMEYDSMCSDPQASYFQDNDDHRSNDDTINVENVCKDPGELQYTISNQGNLQMILNRFVYYLKYTNRKNDRQWRCIDYINPKHKCPAIVITKDNKVVQRISAHTHRFHDSNIMKKVRSGAIFTAVLEAQKQGEYKRKSKIIERTSSTGNINSGNVHSE